jgi:hypothetical protein
MTFDSLRKTNLPLYAAVLSLASSPEAARALWDLAFAEGVRCEVERREREVAEDAARIRAGKKNPIVKHMLMVIDATNSGRIAKA